MAKRSQNILLIAVAGALFVGTTMTLALWPLAIAEPTHALLSVPMLPATNPATSSEASNDLASVDVNLQRALADPSAAAAAQITSDASASAPGWKLVGTSVDDTRPMALLMSPDGTTHWFAAGERSDDGMEVKKVAARSCSIEIGGKTIELQLPPMPADPFAAEALPQ